MNITFRVLDKYGNHKPYSGMFKSEKQADQWYNKWGKWLEKTFDHKLVKMEYKHNKCNIIL